MLKDIVEVRHVADHRIFLRFEDGTEGEIDLAGIVRFDGVFGPLRDPAKCAEVILNRELGTICWPGGADLDPDVLYAELSGEDIPDLSGDPALQNG